MKIKVAVLQYDCPEDVEASIKKLSEMTKLAADKGAKLVVAPETSIGMFANVKNSSTDYLPNLSDIAKRHKVFLCTSFYRKENGEIYNQGYIVDLDGQKILSHKKVYLAPPEKNDRKILCGDSVSVVDTKLGRMGMVICKDGFNKYSHFLYEKFNNLGAEIICAPTWSIGWKNTVGNDEYVKGMYTYGSFISRAYVLMSGNLNRSTESFGRSLIISPVTGVLCEGSKDKEEILVREIDLDEVKRIKEFDSWWQPKKRII